ncbi:MAG TPA: peptidoglycan DD-metalloendopeptidase family protein [Actinomycetota bacterium]|nr:peptidoglycan DD-metalloendopeptidase family protein [Actinomycetota bacterium]
MSVHSGRRGNARLRRGIALAVGLILLAQVSPGSAQTTQERLDEARRQVARYEKQRKAAEAELAKIRADIESLTRQILQALAQRDAVQEQIDAVNQTIKRKGRRVRVLQGRLDDRAREVYIQGPAGVVQFVLEADSLTDLSDRMTFLGALNVNDASTASGIQVEREELKRFQDDLQGLLAQQKKLLEKLSAQRDELNGKFEAQAAITQEIADKKAAAEALVRKLKKKLRRELLAALRAAGSSAPIDASGILKWCPVDPPRSYIDDFGAPRVGHTHQGNDIFAPQGTPIRAPFEGTADEGSNGLGGLTVNVYAPDGTYVYNAHMSAYAGVDGDHVTPGDLIGYVGDTGNAAGTPYHDHFELHPGGGSAVSPYAYLNAVCGVNGGG